MSIEIFLIIGLVSAVVIPISLVVYSFYNISKSTLDLAILDAEELIQAARQWGQLSSQKVRLLIPKIDSMKLLEEKISIFDENKLLLGTICSQNNYPTEVILQNSEKLLINREWSVVPSSITISILRNGRTATCHIQPPKGWRGWVSSSEDRRSWVGCMKLEDEVFILKPVRTSWRRFHLLEDKLGRFCGGSIQCVRHLDHRATIVVEGIDPLISWLLFYVGIYELGLIYQIE